MIIGFLKIINYYNKFSRDICMIYEPKSQEEPFATERSTSLGISMSQKAIKYV